MESVGRNHALLQLVIEAHIGMRACAIRDGEGFTVPDLGLWFHVNIRYWVRNCDHARPLVRTSLHHVPSSRQSFVRTQRVPREPFWINYRGPSADVDKPEHQNRLVGNTVQRARWVDYHAMTRTSEVIELEESGTNSE